MTEQVAPAGATSVLDMMAKGIMNRKKEASKGLTPVGAERKAAPVAVTVLPERVAAPFPNDHPQEVIIKALDDIEHQMTYIQQAIDAVRSIVGAEGSKAPEVVDVKAAEKAADAKAADPAFADRYANLQKEAQDAAYTTPPEAVALAGNGWVCPTHGVAIDKVSPKKRKFRGCPTCSEFER